MEQQNMQAWFESAMVNYQNHTGLVSELHPQFISCNAEQKQSVIAYDVQTWQLNPEGIVHGGVVSSCFDSSLGMLGYYYTYPNDLTTVQLSTSFLAPVTKGDTMYFHSRVQSLGKSLLTLSGELYVSGKLAATATATFKILHHRAF